MCDEAMKNRKRIEKLLSQFAEGELDAAERDELEQVLRSNPQYKQIVANLQALRGRLRRMKHVAPSRDFETILRARIQMSKRVGRSRWGDYFGSRLALPAFGAVAVLLVTLLAFSWSDMTTNNVAASTGYSVDPSQSEFHSGDMVFSLDLVSIPQRIASLSGRSIEVANAAIAKRMIIARVHPQDDTTQVANRRVEIENLQPFSF